VGDRPELLERPEHGPALHHQPRVDDVVLTGPDQQRVREGDHPDLLSLRLQLLVAAEAVSGALKRLGDGGLAVEREDVALRREQQMNGMQPS